MRKNMIPDEIMKYFNANPRISRDELASKTNISNQQARFYCRVYKEQHKNAARSLKKGVALFDIHSPEQNNACMNIVFEFLKDFKPDYLVLGGDQLDLNCISHHNKGKVRLTENARLKKDYRKFQKDILDRLESSIPKGCKKYFMIGNHEYWVERLVDDNPQLEGLVEVEGNLNLDKYTVIPFNKVLTIGEINFIHGIWTNKYHAEKNIRIYNKNIFSGHLHTNQVFTVVSPINNLPRQGVSVGCLCNKNMDYMHEKPSAWMHQFMYWYELEDGTFRYYLVTILNGIAIINGKVYDGNIELKEYTPWKELVQ